jgi:hypothetical protein
MTTDQIKSGKTYENKKGHKRTVLEIGKIGTLGSQTVSYRRSAVEIGPNYTQLSSFADWAVREVA